MKECTWEVLKAWKTDWQGKCETYIGRNVLRESRTFNRLDMVIEKEGGVTCDVSILRVCKNYYIIMETGK